MTKRFDGIAALDEVSLTLGEPEVAAIVGPNGSGKSTLFNVVTGFVKPDGGRCILDGHDITGKGPASIARLGIVRSFQRIRVFSGLTCVEHVTVALRLSHGRSSPQHTHAASDWLALVGLTDRASSLARTLSYGQQKRLALATVAATGARLLLLDEPTSGADPYSAEQIVHGMRHLAGRGCHIVFIEHNFHTVRQLARRVIVMAGGRVVLDGDVENALSQDVLSGVFFQ